MNSIKTLLLLGFLSLASLFVNADEGMWLPLLVAKYNMGAMQQMGLKLSAEQIYSVNQVCLKDAIVSLDHGSCTGSIISSKGLLLTNYHCGYDDIAGQSSVTSDYLTDGFWAQRAEEELPIPGKTVSFLIRMEDVTSRIKGQLAPTMDEGERGIAIQKEIEKIETEAAADNDYEANVESMFQGSEYYLFIYQTYTDIRMVAAPPSSIGKFGGDTDNWVWPRHTGDFCLLRVYSDKEGKPAEYTMKNIALKPKYFLPISLQGITEGDFSLILGYPGTTDRYLTSYGVEQKINQLNPADVKAKWAKMEVLKKYMDSDEATRIVYAGDYAYLANFWKKSLEENKSLTRLKVYENKKKQEDLFGNWVKQDTSRKARYGDVIRDFAEVYKSKNESHAGEAIIYQQEALTGCRILDIAFQTGELVNKFGSPEFEEMIEISRKRANDFYKQFNPELEKEIMLNMFKVTWKNISPTYLPDIFATISKKYKGDLEKYTNHVFKKSIFASKEKLLDFLKDPSKKALEKDPAYVAAYSFLVSYMHASLSEMLLEDKFNAAQRNYIAGLREMSPGHPFYSDANSTMRLTYGSVKAYEGADAVSYKYYSTLTGVMQKEDSTNEEFIVSPKLKELYLKQDFGPYGKNGIMPVCFLTTHDITGGNSGSPVLNGNGELIGLAFDGNYEAMSSDIKYDVNLQRSICVDIRFILFVIDKFAGATYLVDEMKIVK